MSSHPINLAFRFILEVSALASIGLWGWEMAEDLFKYLFAFGLILLFMAIWGIFAVPDDPSRSGKAPIRTPGIIRLIIELGLFGFATYVLKDLGHSNIATVFGCAVFTHYVISYDRVKWLLSR
jgi:hypothetical protein